MTKRQEPNPLVMLNSFQHLICFFSAFVRRIFHPRPQDGVFRCAFNKKNLFVVFIFLTIIFFLLTSCSNIPLIGKKKEEKVEKLPEGKTVTVEGMETIKGVNPPKAETSPPKKPSTPAPKKEDETKVASIPTRPFYTPPLPFFPMGF